MGIREGKRSIEKSGDKQKKEQELMLTTIFINKG